jgi:phage tail protein X
MLTKCIHALRFVTGLMFLVGGVAALAPIAAELMSRPAESAGLHADGPDRTSLIAPAAIGHAIPDPQAGDVSPNAVGGVVLPNNLDQAQMYGQGSAPAQMAPPPPLPAPPSRLPTAFPGVVAEMPGMNPMYRSTLDVPPPPLLDAHGPPPTAPGWVAHGNRSATAVAAESMPSPPASYTVQDGDDLTTLAIRMYGHPGAAAAILAANRDQLADPQILPIGLRLRLPPPWTVSSGRPASGATIEPGPGGNRPLPAGRGAASPSPWMSAVSAGSHP